MLVGVSGGVDSTVLLRLFVEFVERRRARPGAVLAVGHLDHRLDADSAARAEFVRGEAASLGIPCLAAAADVRERSRRERRSLEEAARLERLDFFGRAAAGSGCSAVAVGHTRSDQAETVLLRLVRGSGGPGLGAMPLARPDDRGFLLIRPLLRVSRTMVEALAEARGWPFQEDASNRSPEFARNRVRREVLPHLAASLNPRAEAALARAADLLRDDEDLLGELARGQFSRLARLRETGVQLPREALSALPPALSGRVLRLALLKVRGDLLRLTRRHLAALGRLAASGRGGAALDLPGIRARCEGGNLLLEAVAGKPATPFRGGEGNHRAGARVIRSGG